MHTQGFQCMIDIRKEFDSLAREFDLKEADFYFLDLIPLIEVIWADGQNQDSELALLYRFTTEHIAELDRTEGVPFITVDDANDFLDRFAHRRPPVALLNRLRELFVETATGKRGADRQAILNYCLDIAAACTTRYPFALRERVADSEKRLLCELFKAFEPS
ncbi:MAG: hypothetical protein Kow0065_16300 [Methylomicrobium sp.]